MKIVTIITPLYNAEKYISDTINSVLSQNYTNFEMIIVNDCSTDNSEQIILSFSDPRIKYFKFDKNQGVATARNYTLDSAKGRYITFLDADDLLEPNYLEEQVKFIKDHGPIISSGYRRLAAHSNTPFYVPDRVTYKSIFRGNALSCLTTMYDFEVFKDVRFTSGYSRHEDLIFWGDILSKGYIAYGNHKVLATYRIYNESRNGASKRKLIKPYLDILRKHYKFNYIKCWYLIFRMALYSKRKYRGVK